MHWSTILLYFFLIFLTVSCKQTDDYNGQYSNFQAFYEVNILLLLPVNNTYKFSTCKVLPALLMAVDELKKIDYGSSFKIKIVNDICDCSGITAPVNAMENIYGKRNHSLKFQAVFGPMCD
jgi:hypothetical protein